MRETCLCTWFCIRLFPFNILLLFLGKLKWVYKFHPIFWVKIFVVNRYRTSLLRYEFHLTITWRITYVHEIVGVGREAPWTFLAIYICTKVLLGGKQINFREQNIYCHVIHVTICNSSMYMYPKSSSFFE